jgi:hypothetical protein
MNTCRSRIRDVAALTALMLSGGCASSFVPSEPITAASADRIAPVYSRLFAEYSVEALFLFITPDWPCAIGNVAVDSSHHRLYVQRRISTGLRSSLIFPPGIHTIDLKTGREIHWTQTAEWYHVSRCHFHPNHDIALTSDARLLDLKRGDHRCVLRSTREEGNWYPLSIPSHPVVDEHRFVIIREQMNERPYGPSDLVYVDCRTRAASDRYPLAHLGRDMHFSAAVDDYVLMHRDDSPYERDQLIVLEAGKDDLDYANRLYLEDGWKYRSGVAHWSLNWWITSEIRGESETRVCVYTVPELERVIEMPGVDADEMVFVPATRVLAVIPTFDQRAIHLYQLEQKKEIARIPLPPFDYAGDWDIVADPAGLYIGVSGCQWVHLYAVRPAGG